MNNLPKNNAFCCSIDVSFKDTFILSETDLGIQLYSIKLSLFSEFIPKFKHYLNLNEKNRAERFHKTSDSDRFIICRTLLKFLLSKQTGLNISEIILETDANKKPYLLGNNSIFFNVSHSNDYAIIVIGNESLGVDIEYINEYFDFIEILPTIFHANEINEIETSNDKSRTFYKLWTRKEAIVKATGKGIDDDFREIVSLDGSHFMKPELLGILKNVQVTSFQLNENYLVAVASSNNQNLFFYNLLPLAFQNFLNANNN